MIHPPAVVAVDDRPEELAAIVQALRSLDVACLPVLVNGAQVDLQGPLTGVRLIFFDINYLGGVTAKVAMYETAATVLLKVISRGNGPYILVTWTSKPEDHDALMKYFAEKVPDLPVPAVSMSLPKEKFLLAGDQAGQGRAGGPSLRDEIRTMLSEHPQVGALMQWEMSARTAAGDVVASLLDLFSREERFSGKCGEQLERLLAHMALRAVGPTAAALDARAALNEALVPILLDRMMHQSPDAGGAGLWTQAIKNAGVPKPISPDHAPLLNALSHLALPNSGPMKAGDRGVVFTLSGDTGEKIAKLAGISVEEMASQFMEVSAGDKASAPSSANMVNCRWVLIGVRAVCDQAQSRGILRPTVLALEVPGDLLHGKKKGFRIRDHGAATLTPVFSLKDADGKDRNFRLVANWHWTMSIGEQELTTATVHYRLREALINQICAFMSDYTARPGIVTY